MGRIFERFASLGVGLLVFAAFLRADDSLTIKRLTVLDKFEPFTAHLFHDGHLWVGRSRKDLGAFYRLEVYDSAGNPVAERELRHSARFITAFDTHSALIVGIAASPNHSFYTIATRNGSDISLKTVEIPVTALADRAVGRPGHVFFSDPGGLDDGSPIGQPLQTLFVLSFGSPSFLKPHFAGPRDMVLHQNNLFVVQSPSVMSGGRNVMLVNIKDESFRPLFDTPRQELSSIEFFSRANRVAVTENLASQVLFLDPATGALVDTVKVPAGEPKGIAELGKCVVVASELSKKISFIDMKAVDHPVVATWDLQIPNEKFRGLRSLAVDPLSGRVYARSAYACIPGEPCSDESNGVILIEEPQRTTFQKCSE